MTRTRTTRVVAAAMALGLVAAACGGDDDAAPVTEAPVTDETDTDETDTDETDTDETDTDEPDTDETDTDEPDTDETDTDETDTDETDTDETDTDETDTDEPDTDEPDTDEPDTDETDTDEPAATGVDLSEVCPSPLVIQTDWFPESEYGATYNLIGEPYEIDEGQRSVIGPLWDEGQDTGIEVEVRTGGPAIGNAEPRVQMYTDDSIHLGYSSLDAQSLTWEDAPLISVIAPLEKNPQIIMWDGDVYPEIETIEDLGDAGVIINVFAGGGFSQVFVAQGIWSEDQVDPSYDGSPARFIAEGDIAQQGFASNEPYVYENEIAEFGRMPAFALLHDGGYVAYSQTLAVRPDTLDDLRPCLEEFVPLVQRSMVDYINDPERTNELIVDAVETFDDFWVYDMGVAEYAVNTMLELELVGNGHDDIAGSMDVDRVQQAIDDIRDAGAGVPDDLTAEDMLTNEFLDPTIGY